MIKYMVKSPANDNGLRLNFVCQRSQLRLSIFFPATKTSHLLCERIRQHMSVDSIYLFKIIFGVPFAFHITGNCSWLPYTISFLQKIVIPITDSVNEIAITIRNA